MSIKKTTILNVFLLVSIQFIQSQETAVSNKLEKKDTSKMSNIPIRIVYDSLMPILDQNKEKVGSYYFKSRDIADVRVICKLNNGFEIEIKNPYSNFIYSDGVLFNYGDTYFSCVAGLFKLRSINTKNKSICEYKTNHFSPNVVVDEYGDLYLLAYYSDNTGLKLMKYNGKTETVEFEKNFKQVSDKISGNINIIFGIELYKDYIYICYENSLYQTIIEKWDKNLNAIFKKDISISFSNFSMIDDNTIIGVLSGFNSSIFNIKNNSLVRTKSHIGSYLKEIIDIEGVKAVIFRDEKCQCLKVYAFSNKGEINIPEITDSIKIPTNSILYKEKGQLKFQLIDQKQ